MVFTSYIFLFLFLPLFLLVYFRAPERGRNLVLLIASYIFYCYWRADFGLLLLFITATDFAVGLAIHNAKSRAAKARWLTLSIVSNLGLLAYFKYWNFGIDNLNAILHSMGMPEFEWATVILPVGISFFTFQSMSYTIDVYRGEVPATRNFLDFATFVSMFPQLVAGPIVRYATVEEELRSRTHSMALFSTGITLFCIGFNKKVLLANNLALMGDAAFAAPAVGPADAWLGLAAYTFQLYFDFSGYSDMAVGLGYMLGFHFPLNFDSPYRAENITDFWRRWHISLSTWLRDYLYVSLGGNRGTAWKTYRNLWLTMLLGGLWHGANWTFIVWGAYHGAFLVLERWLGKRPLYAGLPRPVRIGLTFLVVMLGWLPFRSPDIAHTWGYLLSMFGLGGEASPLPETTQPFALGVLALCAAIAFLGIHSWRLAESRRWWPKYLHFALFIVALHEMVSQQFNPFLYFNF